MPRIAVKLDDVESGFVLLPENTYLVKIKSAKTGESDGGPYIQWIAIIQEGEFEGKPVGWRTYLTEKSLWNLKDMLEACGFGWDEDGFDSDELEGAELRVDVEVRTWMDNDGNEEPRNNVTKYHAV